jgi:hypothetical protein
MLVQVRPRLVLAMLASAAALHLVLAACGQSSSNTAQCQSGNCNTGSSSGGAGPAPSGAILAFGGSTAPDGWLICDGSTVSRTQYSSLFAAIGVAHGSGDGATTFNLPDYQGRFLRGVDHGAGRDPDAATRTAAHPGGNVGDEVGSLEDDAYASHTHGVTDPGHSHGVSDPGHAHGVNDPGHQHGVAAGQYYAYYNGSTCSGENFGFTNGGGTCFDVSPGSGASATHVTIAGAQTGIAVDSQTTGIGVSASGASTETRPVNADVVWIIKT